MASQYSNSIKMSQGSSVKMHDQESNFAIEHHAAICASMKLAAFVSYF